MGSHLSKLGTLFIAAFAVGAVAAERLPTIGLLIEKENAAVYVETKAGLDERLRELGKTYHFSVQNAKGNKGRMAEITKAWAQDPKIDVAMIMGSAASSIGTRNITGKPLILGGINHPQLLGVTGDNVAGATYYVPPATVVDFITWLKPRVGRVGILYETPEQNGASVVEVPNTENAMRARGIDVAKEMVRTVDEIPAAAARLVEAAVDFIVIPTNAILYANVPKIRSVTDAASVPIISFSAEGVRGGAMIGITSNNHVMGHKVAEVLVSILEKRRTPRELGWHFPEKYSILINEQTRAKLGFRIPPKIQKVATVINPAG